MIYIAKSKKSLVQIGDISQDEKISESLLRRIVADLEKAGILQSVRGRSGGVKLAREVQKISVYDILEAA